MRIGEFVKKHNTTHDTIRHYIDMGLLTTEKLGGHYKFTNRDSKEFQDIMDLKSMGFSLLEIQELLCYKRLAGSTSIEFKNYYVNLLNLRRANVEESLKEYYNQREIINTSLKDNELEDKHILNLGLPLEATGLLACPNCNFDMVLTNGKVENNMIIEGNYTCNCGFNLTIEEGILIVEKDIARKYINGKPMVTKKEFLKLASPKFINFHHMGMNKILDYTLDKSKDASYLLELDTCVGFFLMEYINHIPKDLTYIMVCSDKNRILNIKKSLELKYSHRNFIFLCSSIESLPLKKESIDIIVDHGLVSRYDYKEDKDRIEKIFSPLKSRGLLIGSYNYFSDKTHLNTDQYKIYSKEYQEERLKSIGFILENRKDIGPVVENNNYNLEIRNKELYMNIYMGHVVKKESLA